MAEYQHLVELDELRRENESLRAQVAAQHRSIVQLQTGERSGAAAISFEVIGLPAPQGSKSAVVIGGKARLIEGRNSGQRSRHGNWRSAVADAARDVASHDDVAAPLSGPLRLVVQFRFPRPVSWPRKRPDLHTSAPDLDKLVRSVGDALTQSGLIRDDALICELVAMKVTTTDWTGAVITLKPARTDVIADAVAEPHRSREVAVRFAEWLDSIPAPHLEQMVAAGVSVTHGERCDRLVELLTIAGDIYDEKVRS